MTTIDPFITYAIADQDSGQLLIGPFYHEALAREAFKVVAPQRLERQDGQPDVKLVRIVQIDTSAPDFNVEPSRLADERAMLKLRTADTDAFGEWVVERQAIATSEWDSSEATVDA